MSQSGETFFTTVGCMDGRVHDVVTEHGRVKFAAVYPDTITEAGLVGKVPLNDSVLLAGLKFKIVDVSIGKHNSRGLIVHGHAECAGNPVSDDQHKVDIKNSVEIIKKFVTGVPVLSVFVHRNPQAPEQWVVEEIQ